MKARNCREGKLYSIGVVLVGMFVVRDGHRAGVFDVNGMDWIAVMPNDEVRPASMREQRDWYRGKFEGEW